MSFDYSLLTSNPLAKSWATLLALTYLTQAIVSIAIDSRFEPGIRRSLFWIIWFPFAFWLILAATAVAVFPRPSSGGVANAGSGPAPTEVFDESKRSQPVASNYRVRARALARTSQGYRADHRRLGPSFVPAHRRARLDHRSFIYPISEVTAETTRRIGWHCGIGWTLSCTGRSPGCYG
jgi:hypothetical protein